MKSFKKASLSIRLIFTLLFISTTTSLLYSCTTLPQNIATTTTLEAPVACFPPTQSCLKLILEQIDNAKSTIYVQTYSFTSQEIADSLIRAHNRGVQVKVLMDRTSLTSRGSKIKNLINSGIFVQVCKVPGIAHNKVLIIDDHTVITGSYNHTQAAELRNAENIVIIRDSNIVKAYLDNWSALKRRE